jgi:hypothetical protein
MVLDLRAGKEDTSALEQALAALTASDPPGATAALRRRAEEDM